MAITGRYPSDLFRVRIGFQRACSTACIHAVLYAESRTLSDLRQEGRCQRPFRRVREPRLQVAAGTAGSGSQGWPAREVAPGGRLRAVTRPDERDSECLPPGDRLARLLAPGTRTY